MPLTVNQQDVGSTPTPTAMKYVKLQRGDDWGTQYVALKPHNENGMANHRRGLRAKQGEDCPIRFPNGAEVVVKLDIRVFPFTVHDHGAAYSGKYLMPGFSTDHNGIPTWFPLEKVEVDFDWAIQRTDYTKD